jgi:shikimate dehydrogenase
VTMNPSDTFPIVRQENPTMDFIGVTTGQSMMTRIFPEWAAMLGLAGAQLIGVDLPLSAPAEQYRQAVAQVKYDPLSLGALITTHKIDLMNAAEDLFDAFDRYADLCHEVSCIVKREGRLIGYARDPINSGHSLETMLGAHYWGRSGAHLLCLGGGGAGSAIIACLLTQPGRTGRPDRIMVVDSSQARLERLQAMVERLQVTGAVEYIHNADPHRNDELMAALPAGSLVINATGMGKDRPGSPITEHGLFPLHGFAWELNYRGEREFLRQAQIQQQDRDLKVHDGWHYFVISWADNIAEVFNIQITSQQLAELARKAYAMRT